MTDPKRWSEGGDARQRERELVLAGRAPKLAEAERRALWASIALSLPPGALPNPLTTTAKLSGVGLKAYLVKGLIFVAALGGLGVGLSRSWPRASNPLPQRAAVAATPPPQLEPVAATTAAPSPVPEVSPQSRPAAPLETKRAATTTSQLREESQAVLEARAALRAGNASQSLALLEQARSQFPRGALGQEREALTIEALAKLGQAAAAQRRAQAFLRAHPQSPYVADLRRIAQP